jgi:hypothetical protein
LNKPSSSTGLPAGQGQAQGREWFLILKNVRVCRVFIFKVTGPKPLTGLTRRAPKPSGYTDNPRININGRSSRIVTGPCCCCDLFIETLKSGIFF